MALKQLLFSEKTKVKTGLTALKQRRINKY